MISSGMDKTDAVYTIRIFPNNVIFCLFQISSNFLILPILCSQFKNSHIVELLPKYIPITFIGLDGQDMPDGISLLSLYLPIHIPSDFVKFKTGPPTVLKWLIVKSVASMDAVFLTKTVVSSASWHNFISLIFLFWLTLIPQISLLLRICVAKISTTFISSRADNGHPCLTPRPKDILPETKPPLHTELVFTHRKNEGPNPKFSGAFNINGHSTVSKAFLKSRKRMAPPTFLILEKSYNVCN